MVEFTISTLLTEKTSSFKVGVVGSRVVWVLGLRPRFFRFPSLPIEKWFKSFRVLGVFCFLRLDFVEVRLNVSLMM